MNTNRRLTTLDGLRGLAALAVVLFHAHGMGIGPVLVRRGYLAVDFFFVLSGFVIARAYDHRFAAGLGAARFMQARLLRLAPLFWCGILIMVLTLALDLAPTRLPAGLAPALAANLLFFPFALQTPIDFVFPLDPPGWSLFFELWVANLVLAVFWRQLGLRAIGALVAASGLVLAITVKQFGADTGAFASSFGCGLPRVLYSFFAGVLLFRLQSRLPGRRLPAPVLAAILLASFLPVFQGPLGRVYDLVCIALLYPALVHLGAQARDSAPSASIFLGEISYALYCIHFPVLECYRAIAGTSPALRAVDLLVLPGLIALAALLVRYCDDPLQALIKRRGQAQRRPVARPRDDLTAS